MKKFALALMASAAMILGISAVANAYPPAANVAVVSDTTPGPGQAFSVEVGCTPPGDVIFVLPFPPGSFTTPCILDSTGPASLLSATAAAGSATATFTAPTQPGTYTITYSGAATGSFTITVAAAAVPGGGLPATGSDSTSTMTIIAIGLFAVGAGLFGVSQVRRRNVTAA